MDTIGQILIGISVVIIGIASIGTEANTKLMLEDARMWRQIDSCKTEIILQMYEENEAQRKRIAQCQFEIQQLKEQK